MDRVLSCVSHTSFILFCAILGFPVGSAAFALRATELPVYQRPSTPIKSTPIVVNETATDIVYICAFNVSECLRVIEIPTLKPISQDFQVHMPRSETEIIKPEKSSRRRR